jgi:1-acyl-sn-glycerol-3-phosphate acyltransferase
MQFFLKTNNLCFPYWIKVLLTSIGYACYFLSSVVFVAIIVPLFLLFRFSGIINPRYLRVIFHGYVYFFARHFLPLLQVYSIVEISGFENHNPKKGSLYVANHRGRFDALLLLSILENSFVLIKSNYARLPIYSAFVKYLDFITIDSVSPRTLATALTKCKDLITSGKSLLVFPEGTRASSGKLLPFKELAFKLATDTDVALFPVIIHSDYPFMSKDPESIFPKKKLSYTVRCLGPMYLEKNEGPEDFAFRVREKMAKSLKILDKGTVWEI